MVEGLTAKQALFVEHYLDCLNATEAARRAGYAEPRQQGSRLLTNVNVAAAVSAGLATKAMPVDEVLARLSAIGRADIRDLFAFAEKDVVNEAGEVVVSEGSMTGLNLHRNAPLYLIKSITPTRYGTKIELHDQKSALDTLARAHGILNTFDWSKVPQAIVDAIADGRLTIDDLKRLAAAPSQE